VNGGGEAPQTNYLGTIALANGANRGNVVPIALASLARMRWERAGRRFGYSDAGEQSGQFPTGNGETPVMRLNGSSANSREPCQGCVIRLTAHASGVSQFSIAAMAVRKATATLKL
jgi:hypothetical protein